MTCRTLFFSISLTLFLLLGFVKNAVAFETKIVEIDKSEETEEAEANTLTSTAHLYGLSMKRDFNNLVLDETLSLEEEVTKIAIKDTPAISPIIQRKIQLIEQGVEQINFSNNILDYLTPQDLLNFPVGIKKNIGGSEFMIGIDSVVLTPTETYFNAFMRMSMPGTEEVVYFYGEHIKMSRDGGLTGDARLQLLTDISVNISTHNKLLFKGDQKLTYVEWDCAGFKNLSVDLDIIFSREIILPEDQNGEVTDGFVTSSVTTQISSWDDFMVELNIPKFQLAKGNGLSFLVQDAVFDMSDVYNSSGMVFPEGYHSPLFLEGNQNLWRGFYIRRAEVHLPQEIKQEEATQTNNGRTGFLVDHLLLDDQGLTGTFTGYNILALEKGRIASWHFSLEEIQAKIIANQFEYVTFDGRIQLPINSETKQLDYHAGLYGWQDYTFQVEALDTMDIPMFGASNVVVLPNSSLEVTVTSGKFKPKANLYGSMDIKLKNPGISLAAMEFQNLQIQTVSPKISADYFSVSSDKVDQMLATFGLSIDEVTLKTDHQTGWTGLGIETSIALSTEFGGTTGFTIWGSENEKGNYAFERLQLNKIAVDITKPGVFSLYGSVLFIEGDPVYGKGFQGALELKLESIGAGLEAMVLFGKVNQHRYWYADVLGTFGTAGIPMGTINLMGIGGGLYYGVEQAGISNCEKGSIGCSLSGIKYIPDESAGLGFKSTAVISIPSGVVTADATFEMSFSRHGGLNQIGFSGSANVAVNKFAGLDVGGFAKSVQTVAAAGKALEGENLPEIATSKDVGLTAKMYMLYDHPNKTFHASLELDINLRPLTGGGKTVLHFAPDKWYIHVGTPDNPIAVNVASLFRASGYFMAGHDMPEPPLPPNKVSKILGGVDLSYMDDLSNLEKGLGFAFGVHFGVGFGGDGKNSDSGRKRFLIFYGKFNFGAGMDVMLANYGKNAKCEGRSKPLGVNGWYANGQMYAYLEAEIGISIRRPRFIRGDYSIIDIAVAALLQARGPNPFWMRGIVGARYNILGGLIKGNCKFEFELGETCNIQGQESMFSNIDIIADISPADKKTAINVFTAPQVAFNMEVGKVFTLKDYDGNSHSIKAELDYFKVFDQTNKEVIGDLEWNAEGDVAIFNPYEILPGETELVAAVKIHFEENKNGAWQKVIEEGKEVVQEKVHVFTTGEEPNYLVASNIEYTYPIERQFNFYSLEYNKGYIQLRSGRSNLFDVDDTKWKQLARFTTNSGVTAETMLRYNESTKEVSFDIPTNLINEKVYRLDLVQTPMQQTAIDDNVTEGTQQIDLGNEVGENELTVKTNQVEGTVAALQDNFLYTINFRTSKYKSVKDKIEGLSIHRGIRTDVYTNVHKLRNEIEGEAFDEYELLGYKNEPLIYFEAQYHNQNLKYFDTRVMPIIYDDYPLYGQTIGRDPNILGLVPIRAIYIYQGNKNLLLTDTDISNGSANSVNTDSRIIYNLPFYMAQDYSTLRNKIAGIYSSSIDTPDRALLLINSFFPRIMKGTYPYLIKYRLPGKGIITSETKLTVNNPFEDAVEQ